MSTYASHYIVPTVPSDRRRVLVSPGRDEIVVSGRRQLHGFLSMMDSKHSEKMNTHMHSEQMHTETFN
jgi:hypothetical protein